MKKTIALLILILITACSQPAKQAEAPAPKDYFAGIKGCFLLYNLKTSQFEKVIGEETCRTQYPACSTFKVPLAVMAFDSGALKDENQVLKWNGVREDREVLNKDHNAKTWMSDSVVWFSQRITPKMGEKKTQKYLNDFNYGNKNLKGGLKQAWLVSPASSKPALKISAYEQAEFMKNLWTDKLPVSKRAMQLTREITYLETSPKGFKLNGKTGSNFYDTEKRTHFGWFIAHIEGADKEYIAVTNISELQPTEKEAYGGPKAKNLMKQILADQGLW